MLVLFISLYPLYIWILRCPEISTNTKVKILSTLLNTAWQWKGCDASKFSYFNRVLLWFDTWVWQSCSGSCTKCLVQCTGSMYGGLKDTSIKRCEKILKNLFSDQPAKIIQIPKKFMYKTHTKTSEHSTVSQASKLFCCKHENESRY